MRLPPRIVIPVACAVLTVGAVIGVLFWQLEGTRAMLAERLMGAIGSGITMSIPTLGGDAPTDDVSLLHMRKGDMHALRGEWADAVKEYQLSAEAHGGVPALKKLTQAHLQRRDTRSAADTLDRLRREGARSEELLLLESLIQLHQGEVAKARLLLQAADESPHKHYGLSIIAIITGDHILAMQELDQVITGWDPVLRAYSRTLKAAYEEYALFPESPELHRQTLLGRALADVQECELALPLLSTVTHNQDDYRDAWIVQGFCELTTERFTEALASLERAYQLDPEKSEIQYFLARTYIAKGDHANALTFLQYALRNGFSPEVEIRRLIAKEALEMGNATLALEQYEALVQDESASIDVYTAFVTAAITANQKEEAYLRARDAVAAWPSSAQAHYLLGLAAKETTRTDEAKTELDKTLSIDPKHQAAKELLDTVN